MRLEGKVAVITGASRGIGRAIALEFAREGADMVVNYRTRAEEAEKVVEEIRRMGRRAVAVRADVSNPDQVEEMASTAFEEFGKVDVLVNNAGIIAKAPLEELTPDEWDRVISVNLNGVFYTMRSFGTRMIRQGGGSIVNIASVAGHTPLEGGGAYSASKAGVIMLTRQAALEWGPKGIRVNAICPGPILTDMLRSEYTEEELRRRERLTPVGRLGVPEDVAKLAAFLASDDASYITGAVYDVDGGLSGSTYRLLHELLRSNGRI